MSQDSKTQKVLKVEGKTITLSRLDKVLYPKTGFTKANIFDYYARMSPWMLPHLKNRMLTLKRFPEGADGMFFYEKRCPSYRPSWMKTKTVKSTHGNEDISYCQIDGQAALLWTANLATLEYHVLLSTSKSIHTPTSMVFDLDPGPEQNFTDCCRLGLKVRDFFKVMKLEVFPKTSGKKGLHLYVPLNTPTDFDLTKQFAHQTALTLAAKYPGEVTAEMRKDRRHHKIFVDWSQNDFHKTTVCVYSLRAADKPFVSTPITWKEVLACSRAQDPSPWQFTSEAVLKRVRQKGDLFEEVLALKQKLPKI